MGLRIAVVLVGCIALAACSGSQGPAKKTKEFFSEKVFGKASPRVLTADKPVPKGGGRYHVGKPYRIAGKTYVPKDQPSYSAVGRASWYGAAFHGRKTANGEIYDMHDLTAAHPTLPLPSYVRVTNLENGRSVVVRVNDRGPFAHNRIIDVSKAVAAMLDFQRKGTAKVRVDYVGRADLDGRDRNMLMASYRAPGQPVGKGLFGVQPRGTIQVAAAVPVAPAPVPKLRTAFASDTTLRPMGAPLVVTPAYASSGGQEDLLAPLILGGGYVSSFAPTPMPQGGAQAAARDLAAGLAPTAEADGILVHLGAFDDPEGAHRIGRAFASFGEVEISPVAGSDRTAVRIRVAAVGSARAVIDAAGASGLSGAYIVAR